MLRAAAVTMLTLVVASASVAESEPLAVSRSALRDGLWEIARRHAVPATNDERRIVFLESYAGENRWTDIARALQDWKDANGPAFDYYRAVVRGDHETALRLLKAGGSTAGLVEARLYEAAALARTNRLDAAKTVWREVVAISNVSDRALALAGIGLMEVPTLRRAYAAEKLSAPLRRQTGLCLGRTLAAKAETREEGFKLIRALVKDSPDAEGASAAYWSMVEVEMDAARWQSAEALLRQYAEIWPDRARLAGVQESRGWVALKLGRREEALSAFQRAVAAATDDEARARAAVKEGDVLSELGRNAEALAKYRQVLERYAATQVAVKLKAVIDIRELEAEGRRCYREFKFVEARTAFDQVADRDPALKPRMRYYRMLCLYGQGLDDEAAREAAALSKESEDLVVRAEVTLWLAKFHYNRREWKESRRHFVRYAGDAVARSAPEALLWAARAALADGDGAASIQLASQLAERHPKSEFVAPALLVQAEALVESARFDEAVLVLDRVVVLPALTDAVRTRAQLLKADALYMLGSDNSNCYLAALEAYRSIRLGGALTPSAELVLSFKIARTLDKLKRSDEAVDQYYVHVVLAYRDARQRHIRFDDDACAAFAKAAFSLADEFESRGRDSQAEAVLRLVASSDVPAAAEAGKRLARLMSKGRIL